MTKTKANIKETDYTRLNLILDIERDTDYRVKMATADEVRVVRESGRTGEYGRLMFTVVDGALHVEGYMAVPASGKVDDVYQELIIPFFTRDFGRDYHHQDLVFELIDYMLQGVSK